MSCSVLPFDSLKPSPIVCNTLNYLFSSVPGQSYVKNTKGQYLWCNTNQASVLSLQAPDLIVGKSVHDLCEQSTANLLEFNDNITISSGEERQFIEQAQFNNGQIVTVVSAKKPIINTKGAIIGLFGTSLLIPQKSDEEKIRLLIQYGLAPKEAQSIYYFVKGETSKEIAKRYSLSYRTIEKYIENVRLKLNISKRSHLFELIQRICQTTI